MTEQNLALIMGPNILHKEVGTHTLLPASEAQSVTTIVWSALCTHLILNLQVYACLGSKITDYLL